MTKEQEAIERLEKRIKDNEDYKTTQVWLTDDVSAVYTVLSMLKEKDREIEHQIEKRNNQKAELAILNEKQKEMNKLINTVSSYKGMLKKEQKDNKEKEKEIDCLKKAGKATEEVYKRELEKKDKIIDLMAEQLAGLTIWNNEKEEPTILGDREDVKQYFKEIAERKSKE